MAVNLNIPIEKSELFTKRLLDWGKINLRKFEWRQASDPYKILVSELLLQKTQAAQVASIYDAFFERFPTPHDLADASTAEIERIIGDLGLRYRVERLQRIADELTNNYTGQVPKEREKLKSLSGIGDYIANAVLCLGFGADVPMVDSNTIRIMERIFFLKSTKKRPRTDKSLWKIIEEMIPLGLGRDFNLALLDFAALVCTSKKPNHEVCPFVDVCDYYKNV